MSLVSLEQTKRRLVVWKSPFLTAPVKYLSLSHNSQMGHADCRWGGCERWRERENVSE